MRPVLLSVLALLGACQAAGTPDDETDDSDDTSGTDTAADSESGVPGEPVARAGADQRVATLTSVLLDGSASADPNGLEPLTFNWTLVSKPPGSSAVLNAPWSAQPSFTADAIGDYRATLAVQNTEGVWDSTPDEVVVTAGPTEGLFVQLRWSTDETDLDLHLLREGADLWDAVGDCHFCNLNPEWGLAGPLDNPSLDDDSSNGFGPETATIDAPADGGYRVAVHYYGEGRYGEECALDPCPPTVATVSVYVNGTLTQTWTRVMSGRGTVWNAGEVRWPGPTLITTDTLSASDQVGCP